LPRIELTGHEHFYHVRDVLKMFYKNVHDTKDSVISIPDDNIKIESILEKNFVTTLWNEGETKKKISSDVSPLLFKREIKRQIYIALSDITGISLPWGSLTGIRPSLVASQCGYKKDILVDYYFVSPEKADLAIETALREDSIKNRLTSDSYHCYIGVPICSSRCSYCSFLSGELKVYSKWIPDYIKALTKELDAFLPLVKEKAGSVYIGGGTPSVLSPEDINIILECINKNLSGFNIPEFTFEAGRADSVTKEKLDIIKKGNVSRICINPQTLNDSTLKSIGRNHTADEFYEIYRIIGKMGFDCVNTDIIAGLPLETVEDFTNTLNKIIELSPDNITLHSLSRKKISRIGQGSLSGTGSESVGYNLPDENISDMINHSWKKLKENSYVPYYLYRQKDTVGGQENTGYSKEGKFCIYNVAMMGDYSNIIGFGAKAVSKKISKVNDGIKIERYYNIRDIILYIKNIDRIIEEKKFFFDFE